MPVGSKELLLGAANEELILRPKSEVEGSETVKEETLDKVEEPNELEFDRRLPFLRVNLDSVDLKS